MQAYTVCQLSFKDGCSKGFTERHRDGKIRRIYNRSESAVIQEDPGGCIPILGAVNVDITI